MLAMSVADEDSRAAFFSALADLRERFETMKPEVEATLRDPALGIEGYLVVWNTGISRGGPLEACGKGGTRLSSGVSLEEVRMLARTMALKNAAAGLPMGGAKTGLRADPKAPGFEEKYRRFAQLCRPFLLENGGPYGGFGFDIGGAPVHARWICDELGSMRCFTGKPREMGGTDYDREGIAGLGVATAARALMKTRGDAVDGTTFAVQGVGAMGSAVIRHFSECGGRLRALADPRYGGGWVFDAPPSDALLKALSMQDAEAAQKRIEAEGRFTGGDTQDVLFEDVDVLFPCAIQNVITETNSSNITARYIAEGANQPVTKEAYPILMEKGVQVVPDFIANAGGIIAAFVELTSESQDKVAEARAYTVNKITDNVERLMRLVDRYGVEPVHAGHYLALNNIFFGIGKERGMLEP